MLKIDGNSLTLHMHFAPRTGRNADIMKMSVKTQLSDTGNLDNFQSTQIAGNDAHAGVYIHSPQGLNIYLWRELLLVIRRWQSRAYSMIACRKLTSSCADIYGMSHKKHGNFMNNSLSSLSFPTFHRLTALNLTCITPAVGNYCHTTKPFAI